jgi:hypothetical protein
MNGQSDDEGDRDPRVAAPEIMASDAPFGTEP